MIAGLLVLLGCQLLGEVVAETLGLPLPGPVVGLVLLLGWLQLREPGADSGLVRLCDALLRHLQLLFVPAGVGVVQYLSVLAGAAVPLAVGLVVSWLLALAAAVCVATALLALQRRSSSRDGGAEGAR